MNVLITGGNGGIGSAIVDIFKKNNYVVFTPSSYELDLSSDESIKQYILSNIKDIDVSQLNAGIYLLSISNKGRRTTQKLVIQ